MDDTFPLFFDRAFRKWTHLIVRGFVDKEHNEKIVHIVLSNANNNN